MKPFEDTVVFDLDGTLSNCSARRYLIQGKKRDYAEFHARLHQDPANRWCIQLMNSLAYSYQINQRLFKIALVSARPKSVEAQTLAWLKDNGIFAYDELALLREDGDSTPARELKRRWLLRYGAGRVLFAVDDCPKVAAMFREEGVTCLVCPGREGK